MIGEKVTFLQDGVEYPAEVIGERDGNQKDLLVNGTDADGNSPFRVMCVPYWQVEVQDTEFEMGQVMVKIMDPDHIGKVLDIPTQVQLAKTITRLDTLKTGWKL